jgi:hypothetical protein
MRGAWCVVREVRAFVIASRTAAKQPPAADAEIASSACGLLAMTVPCKRDLGGFTFQPAMPDHQLD